MDNLFAQYYDYSYNSASSNADPAVSAAVAGGMAMFVLITCIVTYVVYAYLLSRIFQKAGIEAWKAWVPVYNFWVILEMGGQQGFWAVLTLIPIVNIVAWVFLYIAMYRIGLKLGKSGAFVLLAIFIPIVWLVWLACDGSKWQGKKVATKNTKPAAKAE